MVKITLRKQVESSFCLPDSEYLKIGNRYCRIMPDETVLVVHDTGNDIIKSLGIYPSFSRKDFGGAFGWVSDISEIEISTKDEFEKAKRDTLKTLFEQNG